MNGFDDRPPVKTNVIPIGRGSRAEVEDNDRREREHWAAVQACKDRRERQDRALVYLAIAQMKRDRVWHRRLRRWVKEKLIALTRMKPSDPGPRSKKAQKKS